MPVTPVRARSARVSALLTTIIAVAAVTSAWASADAGAVTISPLPGTPDASPHTQISFLGTAPSAIHSVSVHGSRSGSHSGRLKSYASAQGASFMPTRPFSQGERVTVSAIVGETGHEQRVGSSFTVARLFRYQFKPMRTPAAGNAKTVQSFKSQPELHPPTVQVTVRSPESSEDDVFIAANHGYGQWGPMIFNRSGALVWFKPMPKGQTAMDLRVEEYEGKPVLVWWQGNIAALGVGFGTDQIYSSSYRPIAQVRAGNGYWADLHEIKLTPSGSAFLTAYTLVRANLSSIGGSSNGVLQDAVLQQVDVKTGLVMFEWHAYGHIPFSYSYSKKPFSPTWPWDYFHMNSISLDPWGDGNLLISSRNTWAGYEIDHNTGRVLWRLGGKHSSFQMGRGTPTAYQHDMRWQPDQTITVFDNGAVPKVHAQSRAIHERIDWRARTVKLVKRYVRSSGILAGSQGDDQALPGGGSFVGWGEKPYMTEFAPSGQTLFEANLPSPGETYRAYTYPWTATPASPPSLATATKAGNTSAIYASWNGATDVASWRVLAGPSKTQLTEIATAPASGFETEIPVSSTQPDFAVQALDATGQLLAMSPTVSP
jgi:Arylsulfotransferase (ASST)